MSNSFQPPASLPTRVNEELPEVSSSRECSAVRISSTHLHERCSITYSDGIWWLRASDRKQRISLNQSIKQCGWNVGVLSQSLSLGQRTLCRMVEEGLGITCKMWLRQIRIVAACHLLREDRKIASVARELGFHHLSDFTKEFKKLVGVTPSFYMKAERSRSTGYLP